MKNNNKSIHFNSVQLNIVAFVDLKKALATKSLDNCMYVMDNSPESTEQGTSKLQTICKQGQSLNWIIYPLDGGIRCDKTWPPYPRISNVVFLSEKGEDVAITTICDSLKVYGGPDKIREKTPVYYYWAGTIPITLLEGIYKYRFVVELEDEFKNKTYLNLDSLSLKVI